MIELPEKVLVVRGIGVYAMRKVFRKILEILDDTPAVYGQRQRGQSVLELALVSPILIILLAGLAEIGWFAQNYLTIMEVTRVGARTGTVQSGNTHPLYWEDPDNNLLFGSIPLAESDPLYASWRARYRLCDASNGFSQIGFYNFLGCIMTRSMDPLEFHVGNHPESGDPYPDDIIISAFSVRAIDNPASLDPGVRADIDWPFAKSQVVIDTTVNTNSPQVLVVGRFPSNVNECTSTGERDPFDYIEDGALTEITVGTRTHILEMYREEDDGTPIGYMDSDAENQRGFVWSGQYTDPATGCRGSEWGIGEVERLINLQGFRLDAAERTYVPSQGIILVEMHWHHETLSQFIGLAPVLSPVFAILGTETVISVWAAFPLPTVEPRLNFPSGWE